jgi:hypothetical protein
MSQESVLNAIGTWFGGTLQTDPDGGQRWYTGGPMPVIGAMYIGFPTKFTGAQFTRSQPKGSPSGAIAVINNEEPHEERVSLGKNGWYRVAHPITVRVYHRSTHTHAEDARKDLRALQQAMRDRLRSDTTLGGAVFSCGEHDPVPGGATGSGHKFKSTGTASSGGVHETRSDWSLTVVEFVQVGV